MKQHYLSDLKNALQEITNNPTDIKDIINDYDEMYDEALSRGKSDEDIVMILGEPVEVANELRETLTIQQERRSRGNKLVAVSPFIATILFFVTGFYFDGWTYGWVFFLMIPMLGILYNSPRRHRILALSPFISVILMTWIGYLTNEWTLAWLPFLSIPVLGHFARGKKWDGIIFGLLTLLGIILYIVYGELKGYELSWLGFTPVILYSIIKGDILFSFGDVSHDKMGRVAVLVGSIFSIIIAFFLLGFYLDAWIWAWQLFLLIPVLSITLFSKFRLTAIMPFIAVVLFFSIGYFLDSFHISWIFFLLIPIVAILENK